MFTAPQITTSTQFLPASMRMLPSARRSGYLAKIARDRRTLGDAYTLRYASYLNGGFIQPNSPKLFSDRYDELRSSVTIVVYHEAKAIASVRVCLVPDQVSGSSPAVDTFPNEIEDVARISPDGACKRMAEINRLVRSPEAANNQGLVFLLYRLAGVVLISADTQVILSCVRQNHLSFYSRIGFRKLAGPRSYPGLRCPMYLLIGSREDYDVVRSRYPLLNPEALPIGSFADFMAGEPITVS